MTHNCPGDECARCARAIDRIENDGGTYRLRRRGVSLRKPLTPMPYERHAELIAQTRAAAARLTDELDRRRTS